MKIFNRFLLVWMAGALWLAGCGPAETLPQPAQATSPASATQAPAAPNAYPQPPAQPVGSGYPPAPAAQDAPPAGYPAPSAGLPQGKLSARLSMLAGSATLFQASPVDLSKALGLPAKGPGSLTFDPQGRLLVDIRATDLSDAHLRELKDAGAVVTNVSQNYQTVTAFVAGQDLNKLTALANVLNIQEELTPLNKGGGGGGGAVVPPTAYP